jgi:hypothetical protein
VSLASVQAAELMSRAVAPLMMAASSRSSTSAAPRPMTATSVMTPALRSVLTTILERAAAPRSDAPTSRLAAGAPELVTPPAPSEADLARPGQAQARQAQGLSFVTSAGEVADQYAEQRAHVAELQRVAQLSAQREQLARVEAARAEAARAQDPAAAAAAQQAIAQRASQQAAAQQTASQQAAAQQTAAQQAAAQQAAAQQVAAAQQAAQQQAALEQRVAEQRAAANAAEQRASATAEQRAELRAAAERAEAELRERITAQRAAEAQQAAQQSAAERARAEAAVEAADRARIEDRIAQRLAERTTGMRLHEQARAEAAAHARTPIAPARPAASVTAPTPMPALPAYRPSAEVTSAMAGLPPELAALLGPAVNDRPERAMQAITDLQDTLRTVELLARGSAAGQTFEATRGPRLVMPAGLGGLVRAVDRAQTISERPAALGGSRPLAPLAFAQATASAPDAPQAFAPRPARELRMPTLAWLTPAAQAPAAAPSTALGATETAAPAALGHVAWADRWLARFAGATSQSLEMITATAAPQHAQRMQALAAAAPGVVFVAPDQPRGDLAAERTARRAPINFPSWGSDADAPASIAAQVATANAAAAAGIAPLPQASAQSPAQVPGLRLINPPTTAAPIQRFDDDAETPDDVFAAISAAAARGRTAARTPAPSPAAAAPAAPAPAMAQVERTTLADLVAHAAPSAPGAGLSAQLASSPFAPALRHVLPFASSNSFDVRALFGANLGATYLAGLIGAGSRELEIGAQATPTWASWATAPLAQLGDDRIDRVVPQFEAAYVQPDDFTRPAAGGTRLDPRAVEMLRARGFRADEIAAFEAGQPIEAPRAPDAAVPAEQLRELEQLRAAAAAAQAGEAPLPAAQAAAIAAALERFAPAGQVTTIRSALLSWDVTTAADGAPQLAPAAFATAPTTLQTRDVAHNASVARTMIDAMTLPMLGDGDAEQPIAWGAPGQVAERAHAWSVAQERSASDLALDFVTPELVLAARVYGLGPAEAAQAVRLAVAGAGSLGAMASLVDRTFVEAMAIGREARMVEAERARRAAVQPAAAPQTTVVDPVTGTAFAVDPVTGAVTGPVGGPIAGQVGEARPRVAPDMPVVQGERTAITTAFPTSDGAIAAAVGPSSRALPPPSETAFGVERHMPRGAFLWPSATISALGLNAAGSDGQLSMSVAALELLAAQVVAELGTYTAVSEANAAARGVAREPGASAPGSMFSAGGAFASGAFPSDGAAASDGAASPGATAGRPGLAMLGASSPAASEPGEADVLGAAAAFVPAARRARFDALYVALSQSSEGRAWSPAARAARALALAGRTEGSTASTARERAASAWDVLPVVYPGALGSGIGADLPADAAAAALAAAASEAQAYASDGATSASALMSTYVSGPQGRASAASSSGAARRTPQRAGAPRDFVQRGFDRDNLYVAPGLAGLSARAGENLSSFVSPVSPPSAPVQVESNVTSTGAMMRGPTAQPEYVRTGRTGGRHGGGEVEIPPWFEAAARKMLSERSGDSDGISLAELTLVTSTPSSHIAAAQIQPSSPTPTPPGGTNSPQAANTPKIDVEKLAHELYHDIMIMMEVARSRNGDSL